MLTLRVIAIDGGPPPSPMTATFGPQGGTIGRNPGVTLVLPDEGRTISRQQATIAFAAGQFVFAEQGSNPSTLNGEPMGPGRSAPLKHGDTLIMGPYTLQVEVVGAQMPMDERTRMAPPRAAKAAAPRPAPVPAAAPFVPPAPAPAAFIPPAPASMPAFVPPPPASMPAFMPPPPAPPAFIAPPQSPAPVAAAPVHAPIAAGIPTAGDSFDPFASLIAPKPLGSAPVAASPAAFMPAPGAAPAPAGGFDIFAGLGGAAPAPAAGAFADPLAGFGSPGAASMPPPAGAGLPAGGIPDDFDIFGAPPASKPAPTPSSMGSLGADLNIGTPGDSASSIDSLFGLGGSSGKVDPLAVLGAPAPVQGATGVAGSVDPLAMFGGQAAPQGAGPATSNHTPEVNSLFALPKAAGAPPAVDAASRQAMDDVLAAARAPAPNMLATGSFKLNPSAQAPALQPAMPAVAPARPAMVSGGPAGGQAAGQDALLLALLRGLDCPVDVSQGLTEDLMFRIGQLLRETTQGTIELLAARALSKREVKAQATVIMERANNPLKFSPDVASAMPFLLAEKPNRAFMPPVEAMRDSYNDLRSHQVGVMAGMRAALEGVLGRFTPEQLEKRLTQKSMLDSLIPAARKAKLWDLYVEMYRDIAEEAGDDFHKLFGRAFTEAYEEQVDLLRKQDPRT